MKIGDLVRHNKTGLLGVIIEHEIFDYYTIMWDNGKLQHSQKSLTHFEVVNEGR